MVPRENQYSSYPSSSGQNGDTNLDQSHLSKIVETNSKALEDCEERCESWRTRIKEYEDLKSTLQQITSEIHHKVMVPFGRFAFMPGKMVHTNEIMVLLGDNWFVDRSASQAIAIVDRRIEYCSNMLKKIEEENTFYSDKIKLLRDLNVEFAQTNDEVEIREYLDDGVGEKEVLSSIKEEDNEADADNPVASASPPPPKRVSEAEYQALMSHLDDLMKKELEDDQKARYDDEDSSDDSTDSNAEDKVRDSQRPTVNLVKENSSGALPTVSAEDASGVSRKPSFKKVTWNKAARRKSVELRAESPCGKAAEVDVGLRETERIASDQKGREAISDKNNGSNSAELKNIKSILKNRRESCPVNTELLKKMDDVERGPLILPGSDEAFSGLIKERCVPVVHLPQKQNMQNDIGQKNKVSKFRSQRLSLQ